MTSEQRILTWLCLDHGAEEAERIYEIATLAADEERAAIVAWLRKTDQFSNGDLDPRAAIDDESSKRAADAIARGEHLR